MYFNIYIYILLLTYSKTHARALGTDILTTSEYNRTVFIFSGTRMFADISGSIAIVVILLLCV